MLHILDLSSAGNTHVLFNVSMIKVLMEAYPEYKLIFYAEIEHQNIVGTYFSAADRMRLELRQVATKTINPSIVSKVTHGLSKTGKDIVLLYKLLNNSSIKNNDLIFICKAHAVSLLCIKYLKKKYPSIPVISTLHGEIEFLYSAYNSWEKNTGYLYKKILACKTLNFSHLLLNKISKQRLVDDHYLNDNEVIHIDHPYPFSDDVKGKKFTQENTIIIAHVGSLGTRKNAHLLYAFAKSHSKEIEKGLLNFWAIGPIENNALPYKNNLVVDFTNENESRYIPRELFESRMKAIDYAIFFYNPDQFIFRASGTILDVIDLLKPIIALKHPFFDYLFDQVGDIGFICNDLKEMSDIVSLLAKHDSTTYGRYNQQCINMQKFKRTHDIKSIAADFKQQTH